MTLDIEDMGVLTEIARACEILNRMQTIPRSTLLETEEKFLRSFLARKAVRPIPEVSQLAFPKEIVSLDHVKVLMEDPDGWRGTDEKNPTFEYKTILENKFICVKLHRIFAPDREDCFHSHPYPSTRVVLKGGYVEEMPDRTRRILTVGYQDLLQPNFAHRLDALAEDESVSLWITYKYPNQKHVTHLIGKGWGDKEFILPTSEVISQCRTVCKSLMSQANSQLFTYVYFTSPRKCLDVPEVFSNWEEVAHERGDYVECAVYRRANDLIADETTPELQQHIEWAEDGWKHEDWNFPEFDDLMNYIEWDQSK